MSDWKAKRFWDSAEVQAIEGGFGVSLDNRPVKTPAKATLSVPTQDLAQAIAEEWDAQEGKIDPTSMPMTRAANAAIDKVRVQFDEVAEMLAEYGGTDLLCYRATGPDTLIARQAATWDPVLDWAQGNLGVRMNVAQGVMHIDQPAENAAILSAKVHELDQFALTAFHDLVCISGSLVLAFAVIRNAYSPQDVWRFSRVDEQWQIEQWGHDDEAFQMAAVKEQAFLDAARFYQLSLT